jgi:hypothetical protein
MLLVLIPEQDFVTDTEAKNYVKTMVLHRKRGVLLLEKMTGNLERMTGMQTRKRGLERMTGMRARGRGLTEILDEPNKDFSIFKSTVWK